MGSQESVSIHDRDLVFDAAVQLDEDALGFDPMHSAESSSFAVACIPLRRGLSKANEKKSSLCDLCAFAVKKNKRLTCVGN